MTTFQKTVKYLAITLAIFLILCIFGGAAMTIHSFFTLFGGGRADAEPTAYSLSTQEIRSLDIELDAAHLDIVTGDSFSVEGSSGALNVGVTNGVLRISQKTKAWFWNRDLRLTLQVPEDFVFTSAELALDAGKLTAETLSAERLHLELGAGSTEILELNASRSAEIDGGAGKITIEAGTLHNLELEMGVGQLDLTGALTGAAELNCGVGRTEVNLTGSEEDYTLLLEKGLGALSVDGQNMDDGSTYGSGGNRVEIEGGVGAVQIRFEE